MPIHGYMVFLTFLANMYLNMRATPTKPFHRVDLRVPPHLYVYITWKTSHAPKPQRQIIENTSNA